MKTQTRQSETLLPLGEWLAARGPLSPRELFQIFRQLGVQLSARHEKGFLHGQVSENAIAISSKGQLRLSHTEASEAGGTFELTDELCPPELRGTVTGPLPLELAAASHALSAGGAPYDARRIDTYQLGVLVIRLATGGSVPDYLEQSQVSAKVPSQLRPILDRAIGVSPTQRLTDCAQLLRELEAAGAVAKPTASARDTPSAGLSSTSDTDLIKKQSAGLKPQVVPSPLVNAPQVRHPTGDELPASPISQRDALQSRPKLVQADSFGISPLPQRSVAAPSRQDKQLAILLAVSGVVVLLGLLAAFAMFGWGAKPGPERAPVSADPPKPPRVAPPSVAEVALPAPTHQWGFDEGTGDTASDSFGNNEATLGFSGKGRPRWVEGKFGNALEFTGPDQMVTTDKYIDYPQLTVAFWLKLNNYTGINPRVVHPWADLNFEHSLGIGVLGSVVDPNPPTLKQWEHYAVSIDQPTRLTTVYRNGSKVASGVLAPYKSRAGEKYWSFGHNQDPRNPRDSMHGILDQMQVYNRVLSAEEVRQLASAVAAPSESRPRPVEKQPPVAAQRLPDRPLPSGKLLADLAKDYRAGEREPKDSSGTGHWSFLLASGLNPWEGEMRRLEWSPDAGGSPRYMFQGTSRELLTTDVFIGAAPGGGVIATPCYAAPHGAVVRWTSGIAGEVTVQGGFQWNRPSDGKVMETLIFIDGILTKQRLLASGSESAHSFQVKGQVQPGSTVDFAIRQPYPRAPHPRDLNDTTLTASIVKTGDAGGEVAPEVVIQVSEAWQKNPKRPLPKDADITASIENTGNQLAWYRKVYIDSFQRECQLDAPSKQSIEAFLAAFCLDSAGIPGGPKLEEMAELGLRAMPPGKWDPAAGSLLGMMLFTAGGNRNMTDGLMRMEAAERDFAKSNYPPEVKALFKSRLGILYTNRRPLTRENPDRDGRRLIEQAAADVVVAASRSDLTNHDRQMLLRMVDKDFKPELSFLSRYRVVAGLVQEPKADPWLREMVLAREHHRLAWHARGNGFADTVTKDKMESFQRQVAFARVHAVAAWKLRPELPEAAALMIAINMAGAPVARETTRFWFDEAVQADLRCREAYDRQEWALRPRWGGSHREMLSLARECLATGRFETEVPQRFLVIVDGIRGEVGAWDQVLQAPGLVDDFARLFQGYAAIDPKTRGDQLSALAAIYSLAGRNEDARSLIDELGPQLNRNVLKAYGVQPPSGD